MLKNAPNQADNFANFSEMLFNENQLFGSSAGSDLQAIRFGRDIMTGSKITGFEIWTSSILLSN